MRHSLSKAASLPFVASARYVRRKAKDIRRLHECSPGFARELVSRLFGFDSHHDVEQVPEGSPRGVYDEDLSEEGLRERAQYQEKILRDGLNVSESIANLILGSVRPTGRPGNSPTDKHTNELLQMVSSYPETSRSKQPDAMDQLEYYVSKCDTSRDPSLARQLHQKIWSGWDPARSFAMFEKHSLEIGPFAEEQVAARSDGFVLGFHIDRAGLLLGEVEIDEVERAALAQRLGELLYVAPRSLQVSRAGIVTQRDYGVDLSAGWLRTFFFNDHRQWDSDDDAGPDEGASFLKTPDDFIPQLSARAFVLVGVACKRKKALAPTTVRDLSEVLGYPADSVTIGVPAISNSPLKLAFVSQGLSAALPRTLAYPSGEEDAVIEMLESARVLGKTVTLTQVESSLYLPGSYDIQVSMVGWPPVRLVAGYQPQRTFAWIVSELDAQGIHAELEGGDFPAAPSPQKVAAARAAAQLEALQNYSADDIDQKAFYLEDVLDNWRRAAHLGGRTALSVVHEALLSDSGACRSFRQCINQVASDIKPYEPFDEKRRKAFFLLVDGIAHGTSDNVTLSPFAFKALTAYLQRLGAESLELGVTANVIMPGVPVSEAALLQGVQGLNAYGVGFVLQGDFVERETGPGVFAIAFSVADDDIALSRMPLRPMKWSR